MKIVIAGSRSISDYEVLRWALVDSGYWKQFKKSIEVVSGCAKGVDLLGEMFAVNNGLAVHRFPVTPSDWKTLGPSAGHVRNRKMGDFAKAHGGRLLALWDGESKGTLGMVQYAEKIGLEHVLYQRVTDELYRRVE